MTPAESRARSEAVPSAQPPSAVPTLDGRFPWHVAPPPRPATASARAQASGRRPASSPAPRRTPSTLRSCRSPSRWRTPSSPASGSCWPRRRSAWSRPSSPGSWWRSGSASPPTGRRPGRDPGGRTATSSWHCGSSAPAAAGCTSCTLRPAPCCASSSCRALFWVLVSRRNRSVQDVLLRTAVVYD